MFDIPTLQFLFVVGSGLISLLIAYAGIVWRISKAENTVYERISVIEHQFEIEIQRLKQEITETKLHVSQDYMHRDTFKEVMNNIDARLIRLEGKLDAIIYKAHES